MKIGVLGTGMVGKAHATRLIGLGHEVMMGSRTADNPAASAWAAAHGDLATHGTFAEAAAYGDLLVNATAGSSTLAALEMAGAANLAGKVMIDISNPLDYSRGMPATLSVCNTDSLGEQIQRSFPDLRVVKTLNTMNCEVQVDPSTVPGSHTVFVCGDDQAAKQRAVELLRSYGWSAGDIIDLGDITASRGAEMILPLWLRVWPVLGTGAFNFKVVR